MLTASPGIKFGRMSRRDFGKIWSDFPEDLKEEFREELKKEFPEDLKEGFREDLKRIS